MIIIIIVPHNDMTMMVCHRSGNYNHVTLPLQEPSKHEKVFRNTAKTLIILLVFFLNISHLEFRVKVLCIRHSDRGTGRSFSVCNLVFVAFLRFLFPSSLKCYPLARNLCKKVKIAMTSKCAAMYSSVIPEDML